MFRSGIFMSLKLIPLDRRYLQVVIRAFYDGRSENKLVVLTGAVAPAEVWDTFQDDWNEHVLPLTKGKPLSVSECLSGSHAFKGIRREQRFEILTEAVELVRRWTRSGIAAYSCGVQMDDYKRAASESKLNPLEAICVDSIIPRIECQYPEAPGFEFQFDRNEKFLRHVQRFWCAKTRKRLKGPYYLRKIELIGKVSDDYAAVQACDVYTWIVATYCERHWLGLSKEIPRPFRGILSGPPITERWDYETLKSDKRATHRVLASQTQVPEWAMPLGFAPNLQGQGGM